jgi:N-acetylglucosaminyl-diphospho-decaprenol L-rhamnosyltransferase
MVTQPPPRLDIIIVNWNAGQALKDCIDSIARARDGVMIQRVVIVDNASSDDSVTLATDALAAVELVQNDVNRGFAAACNQGAVGSSADYLLFLNPDTRLYLETLSSAVAFMEAPEQQDVGICGIRLVDDDGRPTTSAARFPSLLSLFGEATALSRVLPSLFPPHLLSSSECDTTRYVDQVIGAFFLIRRHVFEALDGFDERFFVYYEEVDLSLRARQRGHRSMYFSGAEAYHRGGLSSEQVKATRLFYALRSRLLYAFKHFSRLGAWLAVVVTFAVEWPARSARAMLRGGNELSDIAHAYRRLRTFVRSAGWRDGLEIKRRL